MNAKYILINDSLFILYLRKRSMFNLWHAFSKIFAIKWGMVTPYPIWLQGKSQVTVIIFFDYFILSIIKSDSIFLFSRKISFIVLIGLKSTNHWIDHCLIISRSAVNGLSALLSLSSLSSTNTTSDVSSAKSLIWLLIFSNISFMYIRERKDSSTDPWGTLALMLSIPKEWHR